MAEESLLDSIMTMGDSAGASFLSVLADTSLKKLLVTSELPPPAVIPFAVTMLIADRMNSKVLKGFAKNFLQAQVIKDRKRALELVELFQAARIRREEEE